MRRAVTEHRGGRDDVDVAETAGTEMEGLRREQLLQEISSPVFAELIPQAVVPHRPWVTSRLSIFTAAFNTTLIKPEAAPKTYEDLADPQWKGKLGVEADDANWFMSIAGAMGEDKAVALFRKIVAVNGMSMRKGHTLLSNLVVAGEVPLALTVYGYRINELKAKSCADRRHRAAAGGGAADRHRGVRARAASLLPRRCSWISSSATASASLPNAATCRPTAPCRNRRQVSPSSTWRNSSTRATSGQNVQGDFCRRRALSITRAGAKRRPRSFPTRAANCGSIIFRSAAF